MSLRTLFASTLLAAVLLPPTAQAQQSSSSQVVPKGFDAQLDAMLTDSRDRKRGLVFHVRGQKIPGVVKEIADDAVLVANQERSRILIRRAEIVAVEGD